MSLPNGDRAIIDPLKLTDYVLSETHPRGRNKARVFRTALLMTAAEADVLLEALRHAAAHANAQFEREDGFGRHYRCDFDLSHKGQSATVRSLWTIRLGEDAPRFVSAFVL